MTRKINLGMRLGSGSAFARAIEAALALSLVTVSGCGARDHAGPTSELDAFGAEVDRVLADDSKSDNPNPGSAFIIGDIAPGAVVSGDVSPSRRLVGWTFRAEDAAAINANAALRTVPPVVAPPIVPTPPPGGTTANMVLYRRTSCLGRWERVPSASGTAIMATRLPSAGEYLLVSGARDPNASAQLSASFAADQVGKIISPDAAATRPYKIAESWIPRDAQAKLRAAGLSSFSEISTRGVADVAKASGLSTAAVAELGRLASWLDLGGITYPAACALQRAGASTPEDYYRLSHKAQQQLASVVVPGSIPWPDPIQPPKGQGQSCATDDACGPTGGLPRPRHFDKCFGLDEPAADQPSTGPHIAWTFWGLNSPRPNDLSRTRPWWRTPTPSASCTWPGCHEFDHPRWYPDPALGWDLIAYNLGVPPEVAGDRTDNRGDLGYLLFYQRHSGLMRLFVYVPTDRTFNSLLATVSLRKAADHRELEHWAFPLEPLPPQASSSPSRQPTVPWKHGLAMPGGPDPLGEYPVNLAGGNWLRAEIQTMFDPVVYQTGEIQLHIDFRGLDAQRTQETMVATLKASGTALPSDDSDSGAIQDVKVATNTLNSGLSLGSGFAGLVSDNPWAAGLLSGGVGSFLGGLGQISPDAPVYKMAFTGQVSGSVTGSVFADRPQASLFVRLSGTYASPLSDDQRLQSHGGIPAYQRCSLRRLGSFGFKAMKHFSPSDPRPSQTWGDPRPTHIPVVVDHCTGNFEPTACDDGTAVFDGTTGPFVGCEGWQVSVDGHAPSVANVYIGVGNVPSGEGATCSFGSLSGAPIDVGRLAKANWWGSLPIGVRSITDMAMSMEFVGTGGVSPDTWQKRDVPLDFASRFTLDRPIVIPGSEYDNLVNGFSPLYVRWKGTMQDPLNVPPYRFNYALAVNTPAAPAFDIAHCFLHMRYTFETGTDGQQHRVQHYECLRHDSGAGHHP